MSNIGSLVAEQTRQTEEFKARKSAEREELSKMTDAGITGSAPKQTAAVRLPARSADRCFPDFLCFIRILPITFYLY